MNITAVTATHDRPEAFRLCERMIARQTVQPVQWLVLDDGKYPAEPTLGQEYLHVPEWAGRSSLANKMAALSTRNLVKGDIVVFVEDDDYYAPDWFELCVRGLKSSDLFGEGRALYYNVRERWWQRHDNMQHASLCSTACRREALPSLLKVSEVCQRVGSPWIDVDLWKEPQLKKLLLDPMSSAMGFRHHVVGMKAMPGSMGYSDQHRRKVLRTVDDPELEMLTQLVGADAEWYRPFYDPVVSIEAPARLSQVTHSLYAQTHGNNWWEWLGRFRGRRDVHGLEIGNYGADTPEWVLDNVLTDSSTTFTLSGLGEAGEAKSRLVRFSGRVFALRGDSLDLAVKNRQRFDIIFVSRHHDADAVLRDAVAAFEMLKSGGVMVLADYKWAGSPNAVERPRMAIDYFLACYAKHLRVLDIRGEQAAIIKK